jgi:protein-tyrosine phosphatase
MRNELYWIDGPWTGKLALAARPRGGDWLEDDLANWKQAGIDTVLSLLTRQEEDDLDLRKESDAARRQGIEYVSFPIADRQIPASKAKFASTVEKLGETLSSGKNVLAHCRQGIGRSGLVATCLLVAKGCDPESAMKKVSAARGVPVPETPEQKEWIHRYATVLTGASK